MYLIIGVFIPSSLIFAFFGHFIFLFSPAAFLPVQKGLRGGLFFRPAVSAGLQFSRKSSTVDSF